MLCISGTYNELLNYVIFATLIFYLLTTVSLFRLRRLRPDLPRPVKAFGYPILPALYICANAFLLVVLLADPQQRKFSALGLAHRGQRHPGVPHLAARRQGLSQIA